MPMTFSHGCLLAEEHGEAGWVASVSCSSHLGFCVISKWSFFSGCPQLHSQPSQPNIPGLTSRLTIPFIRKRERDSFRKGLVWRLSSLTLRNVWRVLFGCWLQTREWQSRLDPPISLKNASEEDGPRDDTDKHFSKYIPWSTHSGKF